MAVRVWPLPVAARPPMVPDTFRPLAGVALPNRSSTLVPVRLAIAMFEDSPYLLDEIDSLPSASTEVSTVSPEPAKSVSPLMAARSIAASCFWL
jgi:hypothetical protein